MKKRHIITFCITCASLACIIGSLSYIGYQNKQHKIAQARQEEPVVSEYPPSPAPKDIVNNTGIIFIYDEDGRQKPVLLQVAKAVIEYDRTVFQTTQIRQHLDELREYYGWEIKDQHEYMGYGEWEITYVLIRRTLLTTTEFNNFEFNDFEIRLKDARLSANDITCK